MAAGVPCLSSVNAGASEDLIVNGENGYIVDYQNKAEIVEKINFIIENPEKATELGKHAGEFIRKNASLSNASVGFVKAIKTSLHLFI